MVARNPGGLGMKPSSDRSMVELLIWLSRVTHGLWREHETEVPRGGQRRQKTEHRAHPGIGLAEQHGALGALTDAEADRRADAFDKERDAHENADGEHRLGGPVLR